MQRVPLHRAGPKFETGIYRAAGKRDYHLATPPPLLQSFN